MQLPMRSLLRGVPTGPDSLLGNPSNVSYVRGTVGVGQGLLGERPDSSMLMETMPRFSPTEPKPSNSMINFYGVCSYIIY